MFSGFILNMSFTDGQENNMKKIICTLISLSLMLCAFSSCEKQSEKAESGQTATESSIPVSDAADFVYDEYEGGIRITGYKGTSDSVNIPEEINGKTVTAIGEYAFDGYEEADENEEHQGQTYKKNNINSIKSVIIPSGVKILEKGAFTNCYSLGNVTLPEGLEVISEGSFACCDAITSIVIPSTVKTIEGYVFYQCYGLTEIKIGKNTESIGDYAFLSCKSLKSVKIPDSVKKLGTGCFTSCYALEKAELSSSITEIPDYCFYDTSVSEIKLHKGITEIGDLAFCRSSDLTEIKIPSSVVSIGEKAFYTCPVLNEVTVPETVSEIGMQAFGYVMDAENIAEDTPVLQEGFTIKTKKGSAAEKYANENNIKCKAN